VQALKVLVVVMGVLIVLGTGALIVGIYQKAAGGPGGRDIAEIALNEGPDVRVVHSMIADGLLVLHLRDLSPRDRLVILDLETGAVVGRVSVQQSDAVPARP
jgi:hypothetical protein